MTTFSDTHTQFYYGKYSKAELAAKFVDCERRLAIAMSSNKQLLEVCKKVEWVCDPEQRTEDTQYCPWCWGVKPGQWHANHKAQVLELIIDHYEDCPRQAAIAAAKVTT